MSEEQKRLDQLTEELKNNATNDDKVVRILLERASVYESLEQYNLARADVQAALQRKPDNKHAQDLLRQLFTPKEDKKEKPENTVDPQVLQFQKYAKQAKDNVSRFVQSPGFVDVLAACGKPDTPSQIKATAYMILTQILNPTPDQEDYPMQLIIETCAKCFSRCVDSGKNAEKLLAYRTLSAIFEAGMTVGATLLSQEGVVEEMLDVIEFEIVPVQIAMTDVMAIAAGDKTCQNLLTKYASQWLAQTASRSKEERLKTTANMILAKLRAQPDKDAKNDQDKSLENAMDQMNLNQDDLISALIQTIKNSSGHDTPTILQAVEGLAYSSLQPAVKETIANDPKLIKSLVTMALNSSNGPVLFGIGTIFANLTMYKPVLDEKQKQINKLRNLANQKKDDDKLDPAEEDKAVERRITIAVENGVSLALLTMAKNSSANLRTVAAQTYLNLATPQTTRGKLLQQGIVRGLLPLAVKDDAYGLISAQALAKIAITTDPRIAFGPQSLELVRPMIKLCKDTMQLRQFEGLMALTNLASVDDEVRLRVFQEQAMPVFENLQLHDNELVQRAATEMICNMMFCDPVFELYSKNDQKLRLLLILSDHEDVGTRRAASGAVAILANSKETCERLIKMEKGSERISRLLDPEEEADVKHRGIEIVRCVLEHEGKPAMTALVQEHVDKKLVAIVKQSNVPVVRTAAMEVLKMFVQLGHVLQDS